MISTLYLIARKKRLYGIHGTNNKTYAVRSQLPQLENAWVDISVMRFRKALAFTSRQKALQWVKRNWKEHYLYWTVPVSELGWEQQVEVVE